MKENRLVRAKLKYVPINNKLPKQVIPYVKTLKQVIP